MFARSTHSGNAKASNCGTSNSTDLTFSFIRTNQQPTRRSHGTIFIMRKLKYYFTPTLYDGIPEDANVRLAELHWNDYGYFGYFNFDFLNFELKVQRTGGSVRIGRISKHSAPLRFGELSNKYQNTIDSIYSGYITFPDQDLCINLLLNFSLEEREQIAKDLNFNFADRTNNDFSMFRANPMYGSAILRNQTEEEFIECMQNNKKIFYCELPINEWI